MLNRSKNNKIKRLHKVMRKLTINKFSKHNQILLKTSKLMKLRHNGQVLSFLKTINKILSILSVHKI
jgi:hypothetical protein